MKRVVCGVFVAALAMASFSCVRIATFPVESTHWEGARDYENSKPPRNARDMPREPRLVINRDASSSLMAPIIIRCPVTKLRVEKSEEPGTFIKSTEISYNGSTFSCTLLFGSDDVAHEWAKNIKDVREAYLGELARRKRILEKRERPQDISPPKARSAE